MNTEHLKNMTNKLDIIDPYRTLHTTTSTCIFYIHRTLAKIYHVPDHKVNYNKFQKTNMVSCRLSFHTM